MKRRVALCGAGMVAGAHALAARSVGLDVVAVASRRPERARLAADQVGARPVTYDDLPAGADLVVVATPPARHAPDALELLPLGVGVLVEKPFAHTLAEADELVLAAEDAGQRLAYGENLAHAPVVVAMLRHARRIPAARSVEVRALQGMPTWGESATENWGGGALFDLGAHPVALALMLADAVHAGAARSLRATVHGGEGHVTDEHAEVEISFASGLVARVVASWRHPGSAVWDAQIAGPEDVVRCEILPQAELSVNGDVISRSEMPTDGPSGVEALGFSEQLRSFAEDLAERRRPVMDAAFGRRVLEVICAAYASDRDGGEPVALPFGGARHLSPLQIWRSST